MPSSSDFQPQATSTSNIDNVAIIVQEAPVLLKALQKVPYRLLGKPYQKSDLQRKLKEEKHLYLVPAREEYKGKIDDPDVENKNLRGVSTFLLCHRLFLPKRKPSQESNFQPNWVLHTSYILQVSYVSVNS